MLGLTLYVALARIYGASTSTISAMDCPHCQAGTRVVETRSADGGTALRRRRECPSCGERFTTYERWDPGPLFVRKRDGERERFDPIKLRAALMRAAHKRPVRADQVEQLVDGIEAGIRERRRRDGLAPGRRAVPRRPSRARRRGLPAVRRRLRPRNFRAFGRGSVPSASQWRMPSHPHKLLRGEGPMGKTAAKTAQTSRDGLTVERRFTTAGVHPFDEVEWELRDAVIGDPDDPAFEQREVEFPATWSQNATNIVAQKYFRGSLGAPERERSVKQMIERVAGTIAELGPRGRLLRHRCRRRCLRGRADPHPSAPGRRLQQPRVVQRRLAREPAVQRLLHPLGRRRHGVDPRPGTARRGSSSRAARAPGSTSRRSAARWSRCRRAASPRAP